MNAIKQRKWLLAALVILSSIAVGCSGANSATDVSRGPGEEPEDADHLITILDNGDVDKPDQRVSKSKGETVQWKAPDNKGDWLIIFKAEPGSPLKRWAIEVREGKKSRAFHLRGDVEPGEKGHKYSTFNRTTGDLKDPRLIVDP